MTRFRSVLSAFFCGALAAQCASAQSGQPAPTTAPAATTAPVPRPPLAIIGFTSDPDADPRDAWIPIAAEEDLTWRLRRVPGLIVVPTVRAYQARRELQEDEKTPPAWGHVAEMLGAKLLISGVCSGPPDALTLTLTLSRLGAPESQPEAVRLPAGRILEVLEAAARWVLGRLNVSPDEVTVRLVFSATCRSPSALEYYGKAIAAARSEQFRDTLYYADEALGHDRTFRPAIALMAQVEMRLGGMRQASAVARLRLLAELARRADDPLDRAESELAQGLMLQVQRAYEPALLRFENALAITFERDEPYDQIAAMNDICDLYLAMRPAPEVELSKERREQFERNNARCAAEWQEAVLELLGQLGDAVAETPAANKLALIYERLDDPERALALHQRTLASAERTGARKNQATAWMFIGQSYRRQKHWEEALNAVSHCLSLADDSAKPAARVAMAGIYADMSQPSEALGQYELAYEQVRKTDDLNNQLVCLREIATLRMQLGQKPQALAALQEAIDIAHALNSPDEQTLSPRLEEWRAKSP